MNFTALEIHSSTKEKITFTKVFLQHEKCEKDNCSLC